MLQSTTTSGTVPTWALKSAAFGGFLWLVAPVSWNAAPRFGSIEHLFVALPLVLAPLALTLLFRLLGADAPAALVRTLQPIASALVLASLCLPRGPLAGGLALGWLATTLLIALGGLRRVRAPAANANLVAALVFLPVGAIWLVLSRLGWGPSSFAPITVFLAALHFHFTGFTLQILIAATGRRLVASRSPLAPLQRCLAVAAIAGLPLIAAGNLADAPLLKFGGVSCVVLATLALVITSSSVARRAPPGIARGFLAVSAASLGAGMLLAGVYAVGELTGVLWLSLAQMVTSHGSLNAVGFTLCGLLGQLRWGKPLGSVSNSYRLSPS